MNNNDRMEINLKAVLRFLAKCSLLVRIRRALKAVLAVFAIAGAGVFILRFSMPDSPITFLLYALAVVTPPLALFTALLPTKDFSVEKEVDSLGNTKSTFCAFASEQKRRGKFFPAVCARAAKNAEELSPFRTISLNPGPLLPAALLGCILGIIAFILPARSLQSDEQLFVSIVKQMQSVYDGSQANSGTAEGENKLLQKLMRDIERQYKNGNKTLALAKLNELIKVGKRNVQAARDKRKSELKEAGIPEPLAEILSKGLIPKDGFKNLSVSSAALGKAAKRFAGSAMGASLARASMCPANSAEQVKALQQALEAARLLREQERAQYELFLRLAEKGNGIFNSLSDEQKRKLKQEMANIDGVERGGSSPDPV